MEITSCYMCKHRYDKFCKKSCPLLPDPLPIKPKSKARKAERNKPSGLFANSIRQTESGHPKTRGTRFFYLRKLCMTTNSRGQPQRD